MVNGFRSVQRQTVGTYETRDKKARNKESQRFLLARKKWGGVAEEEEEEEEEKGLVNKGEEFVFFPLVCPLLSLLL